MYVIYYRYIESRVKKTRVVDSIKFLVSIKCLRLSLRFPAACPLFPPSKGTPYTPHFLLLYPILLSLISKLISWSGLDSDLDFLDSVFSFIVIHCEKNSHCCFIFSMIATKWRLHTWYERTNFTDGFWIQSFTLHSFFVGGGITFWVGAHWTLLFAEEKNRK